MDQDTITFDGSCAPNPGGVMRLGAIIATSASQWQIQDEVPAQAENTVNVAEYRALILGLRSYLDAGGTGPVIVRGDSQLVMRQMSGKYATRGALVLWYATAWDLMNQAGITASFEWIPREQNGAADLLTRDPAHRLPEPDARTPGMIAYPTDISPDLQRRIAALNTHASPGFRDFARLRVGGRDRLSRCTLNDLQQAVLERAPAGTADRTLRQVQESSPDPRAQAVVLRWFLRGLALELAIQKQRVDAEIAANAPRHSPRK